MNYSVSLSGISKRYLFFIVWGLFCVAWPGAAFADTNTANFGEPDEHCEYTGLLGAPFPGVPDCVEGRTTEMPTCKNCTSSWIPERDEKIECEDPADCVQLTSKFMSCAGPIGPFAVDDEDNTYFWAGRWTLHSLDSQGNLRWRYKFCNPPEDSLCVASPEDCQPETARMVPMVMDYYGTLFFFIGDVFYAISSEGELLLSHRIDIPEVPVRPGQNLTIADGPANVRGGLWYNTRGAPILHKDGTISVAFGISMYTWTDELLRTGVIRLSRSGAVQETGHFLWKDDPPKRLGMTRLAGTQSGQLTVSGRRNRGFHEPVNVEDGYIEHGAFYVFKNLDPLWNMELPFGYSERSGRDYDEIETDLAVGPSERVFGMTFHGAVYAFDIQNQIGKRIFNFHDIKALSWQNRPVIAADGTMYLTYFSHPLGPGVLWAMDTDKLWNNPIAQRHNPSEMADPADYEGLKWRKIYSGSGGWSTPVLSKNGRLYEAMGGIGALDPETGEQIWRFGERTMASAPTILSDGTIVVGQGITGRIFFLKEDTPNGGMADEGWPGAMRDHYLSNNAAHPFRWDRSGDAPYPPLEDLLDEAGPCWNEVGWDVDTCGPLPDHSDRDVPGDEDAGAVDEDATSVDAGGQPPSDAAGDVGNDSAPEALGSRGCVGCSASGAAGGPGLLFWGMLFGGAVFWRLLARRLANPTSPV